MAKISAKGAVITITDSGAVARTISSDVDLFELSQDAGALEVTGFTDPSKNYITGLPVYEVTLNVIYDNTATTGAWAVLKGDFLLSTPTTLTIKPDASGQTLTLYCMVQNLPMKGTPNGKLEIGSVKLVPMGTTAPAWA